jgi:CubicO group peptidase (beta-lactamase class C family)
MNGWVDEGFGAVADTFTENFALFDELGAAVTVYAGGRKVVELWNGSAGPELVWSADTVVPVFSCAKGLVGVVVHLLAQSGRLDLDAPIADYWPEFGAFGKEMITSRMVLGHRAGIPVLDQTVAFADIARWTPVIEAVQDQKPLWEPGTSYEYHGHVFGFVLGEVVRRITGQLPGAYFRSVVGDPLGLRAWIGLPYEELGTLARLTEAEGRPQLPPEHLLSRIVTMNGVLDFPGLDSPYGWNSFSLLSMELPGAGAVASASGLAGVYAAAFTGIDDNPRLLTPETVADVAREVSTGKGFLGFDAGARWGSGFLLNSETFRPTLGPRSLANDGAGGQFAFADDEHEVAFAYVTNKMIGHGDARATRLVAALKTCLG